MSDEKKLVYHAHYGDCEISSLGVACYNYCPTEIAIEMNSPAEDGPYEEPFATMTVCLAEAPFDEPGFAYVDTNNLPEIEKFIKDNKLGVPTGFSMRSGFCTFPLYKFNLDEIKKYVRDDMSVKELNSYLAQFKKTEA